MEKIIYIIGVSEKICDNNRKCLSFMQMILTEDYANPGFSIAAQMVSSKKSVHCRISCVVSS